MALQDCLLKQLHSNRTLCSVRSPCSMRTTSMILRLISMESVLPHAPLIKKSGSGKRKLKVLQRKVVV